MILSLSVAESRRRLLLVSCLALLLHLLAAQPSQAADTAAKGVQPAQEVRTTWTGEFGLPGPLGLAYVDSLDEFLVVGNSPEGLISIRMDRDQHLLGEPQLPSLSSPGTLTYVARVDSLAAVDDGAIIEFSAAALKSGASPTVSRVSSSAIAQSDPRASANDPVTGDWFVVPRSGKSLIRISRDGAVETSSVYPIASGARAVAVEGDSGAVFVLDSEQTLIQLDGRGRHVASFDLKSLGLMDPTAMVFAPTSDTTDDPANLNLFIADSGGAGNGGGIVEASLDVIATATVPVDVATLVRTTATSGWNPASPDPSGVVFLGASQGLLVVDSEVDEVTGAGWHNVNMWRTSTSGVPAATGAFWGPSSATYAGKVGFSREPTGVGYSPNQDLLFVSDDDAGKVFVLGKGQDGRFGTSDDPVGAISASSFGSADTEDPEYDVGTGSLFFLDGVGMEIYRIDPVDGVFGNGDDTETQFDISHLGPKDFEGLASNPARGTLYVGARATRQIFEITKSGTVLRVISLTGISGLSNISGLALAPASNGSGVPSFYVVDRAVDNGPDPNENDGKLFEVTAPDSLGGGGAPQNMAPVVSAGPDLTLTLPGEVDLVGTVTDDGLPEGSVVSQQWSVVSAPQSASVIFSDATSPTTSVGFSVAGTYTLQLTATDTQLTSSDRVNVVVNAVAPSGDILAISQSTAHGTVSGGLENTFYDDGSYQVLTETLSSRGNRARLESTWTFNLPAGSSVVFRVNSFKSGAEGFKFSYATSSGKWRDMVVVQATQDGTENQYTLPGGTTGPVMVRVRDLDQTRDDRTVDQLRIDQLVFTNSG